MAEQVTQKIPPIAVGQRYYKLQMKAWTRFDPSMMDLNEIAANIERGAGFLTAIEVVRVAEELNAIEDSEAREQFETMLAVERIMRKAGEIPKALRDKLSAALAPDQSQVPGPDQSQKNDSRPMPLAAVPRQPVRQFP